MDQVNAAANTCEDLRKFLVAEGFTDEKIEHYRKDGLPFAIEVRYVYGETTVYINALRRKVDNGTVETFRGTGDQFVSDVANYVRDCLARGYIVDPAEHGLKVA